MGNITAKHEDLMELANDHNNVQKRKPSDFLGCNSEETALKMISDIEQSREGWERNS